jgi:hypothetical protein
MTLNQTLFSCVHTRGSQKVETFFLKKRHIYYKYTKTKLILLFNIIPLDFNAPVPAFHEFFNSVRKKKFFGCVFNHFSQRQFLERIIIAGETWLHHYEPENKAQRMAWKRPTSPVAKKFSQPSAGKIMLTLFCVVEIVILVHFTPKGPYLAPPPHRQLFPYVSPNERSSKRKKIFTR